MLVLSLVLTGVGIWAGDVIVSVISNQLIEQMTGALRSEVDKHDYIWAEYVGPDG